MKTRTFFGLFLWGFVALMLVLLSGSEPGLAALFWIPTCLIFGLLQGRFATDRPWRNAWVGFVLSVPYWFGMMVIAAYTLPSDCTFFLPSLAPLLLFPASLIGFTIAFVREEGRRPDMGRLVH